MHTGMLRGLKVPLRGVVEVRPSGLALFRVYGLGLELPIRGVFGVRPSGLAWVCM